MTDITYLTPVSTPKRRYPDQFDALLPKKPGDPLSHFAIEWAVAVRIDNEEAQDRKVPKLVRLALVRSMELDPTLWFADQRTAMGVARYLAVRAAQAGARHFIPRDITIEMQS